MLKNMKISLNKLPQKKDSRGVLSVAEDVKDIPFNVRRVYFLTNLKPDLPRGFHAHCELQQLMICVKGSLDVLLDDGLEKSTVRLQEGHSLLIDKMIWHEMSSFSEDCVLSVLASDVYKESDYIRDYDSFLQVVKGR